MNEELSTILRLDQETVIRGESVYFDVTITNTSRDVLEEVMTLAPDNEALVLEATGPAGRFTAHQGSRAEREGVHHHGPRGPETMDLPPGGVLNLRDDLLTWLAELPPGNYDVTAAYKGPFLPVESAPVKLRVLSADVLGLDTPRFGNRLSSAPLTGAAVVQFGREDPDAGKLGLFYQHQSQGLPRSPVHGLRTVVLPKPVLPLASTAVAPAEVGHLVWSQKASLMVARVDVSNPQVVAAEDFATPYVGEPLRSPLTRRDGTLHVPFGENGRTRACLLTIGAEGRPTKTEVPLGSHAPLGPHAFLWNMEDHLYAIWAKPRGREFVSARLPLDDLAAGFSTPVIVEVDHPILWIEAYMDADAPLERRPPDADTPPPDAVTWLLVEAPGGIDCLRINLSTRQPQKAWSIPVEKNAAMNVVCSVVSRQNELAVILQDGNGILHYGSTISKQLKPLTELVGSPIDLQSFPGLLAGGGEGVAPWIYVRYIDRKERRVAFCKLEPEAEHDPMDGPRPASAEVFVDEEEEAHTIDAEDAAF